MGEVVVRARLALGVRDLDLAQKHAHQMKRAGFQIVHVGARGIDFQGTVGLFESVFDCEISVTAGRPEFASAPVIPNVMREGVSSVYFPTKPILFP